MNDAGLYFWRTMAVVGGVMVPWYLLNIVKGIASAVEARRERVAYQQAEALRRPPFDEIVITAVPNPDMIGLSMRKGGEQVNADAAKVPPWLKRLDVVGGMVVTRPASGSGWRAGSIAPKGTES